MNLDIVIVEPQGLTSSQSDYSIVTHLDPFEYSSKIEGNNSPTNLKKLGSMNSREFLTPSYIQFHDVLYQGMSTFLELNNLDSDRLRVDLQHVQEEGSNTLRSLSMSNGEPEHTRADTARNFGHYHRSLAGSDYVELCPIINDSSQTVFLRKHQDRIRTCYSDPNLDGCSGSVMEKISDDFTLSSREIATLPDQAIQDTENGQSSQSREAISPQSNVNYMDKTLSDKDTDHVSHNSPQCTNRQTNGPDQVMTVECDLDGTQCEVKEPSDNLDYFDNSESSWRSPQ